MKSKNPQTNFCGYGVHYPNNEFSDVGKPFKKLPKTNQRAELYAICVAIETITQKNNNVDIKIYSDSEYSIKSLTIWIKNWKKNNWIASTKKPVANKDIIQEIDRLIENHNGQIKFRHVKAHTGKIDFESIHNDIADKLAKHGATSIL